MQAREIGLAVRFNYFTEVGTSHRFQHPQFLISVMNSTLEVMFREIIQNAHRPVRQLRIAMFNLERLDTQPTLWEPPRLNAGEPWRRRRQAARTAWKSRVNNRCTTGIAKTGWSPRHPEGQVPVYTAAGNGAEPLGR
jgi:hypothetical protein